jgi:hypothetical protein
VALLSSLATSLQNASRLTDDDRAVMLAKSTMEELLARTVCDICPDLPHDLIQAFPR